MQNGQPICNGVLLLNYTVITSASCLVKSDGSFYSSDELSVAIGFLSIESNGIDTSIDPQYYEVRNVITHGRFNKDLKLNNIALLKVIIIFFL